jgi:ABC-2 type transport system ATP-binding protein
MEEAERLCDRVAIVDRGRIIALGAPRELIASLGADQVVEFLIDGDAAGVADAAMRVPGVLGSARDEQTVRLRVAQLAETLPALLARSQQERWPIAELRTHAPTLEDVFMALTGRHLRDD